MTLGSAKPCYCESIHTEKEPINVARIRYARESSSKKWWIAGAGAAVALAAYSVWVEPRWLQLRTPRIHIRNLPGEMEGFRVGLLTDFHAGTPWHFEVLRRAVRMIMAEPPDLIALTGDFASDRSPDFSEVLRSLEGLQARHGVFAVPGNHDYTVGIDKWREQIGRHPQIRDLTNRSELFSIGDAQVCVAGVDDFYKGRPHLLLPPAAERAFTLLLAHSPDQAERCRREDDSVDLIVSGHTHAGQVRIPFFGPPVTSADHPDLYDEGLRRRPWTQVYTSRGIGMVHFPIRMFARPEVTVLTLTAAPRPPLAKPRPLARWKEPFRISPLRLK